MFGVPQCADQGDDVEAELVLRQGETPLLLGAQGDGVAGAVRLTAPPDLEPEAVPDAYGAVKATGVSPANAPLVSVINLKNDVNPGDTIPGAKRGEYYIRVSTTGGPTRYTLNPRIGNAANSTLDLSGKQLGRLTGLQAGVNYLLRVDSPNQVPTIYSLKFELAEATATEVPLGTRVDAKRRDVIRRADGRVIAATADERRHSTPELLAVEKRLIEGALARRDESATLLRSDCHQWTSTASSLVRPTCLSLTMHETIGCGSGSADMMTGARWTVVCHLVGQLLSH